MDGELALKYARSRHADGVEGSDFARARRQQKIIEAVKDKLLYSNLLLNPQLDYGYHQRIPRPFQHQSQSLGNGQALGQIQRY